MLFLAYKYFYARNGNNVFLLNCVIVQFVYTVLYLGRIRYMYVTYHIVSCIFERLQHPLSGLVKLMHARPAFIGASP